MNDANMEKIRQDLEKYPLPICFLCQQALAIMPRELESLGAHFKAKPDLNYFLSLKSTFEQRIVKKDLFLTHEATMNQHLQAS